MVMSEGIVCGRSETIHISDITNKMAIVINFNGESVLSGFQGNFLSIYMGQCKVLVSALTADR
jgi:hypothetical protein